MEEYRFIEKALQKFSSLYVAKYMDFFMWLIVTK